MKKILLSIAAVVFSAGIASAAEICNFNADFVNVRSGPSAIDFPVVDQLSNGHYVIIRHQTINVDGYVWSQVVYNGYRGRMTGWIFANNICE